MRPMIDLQLFAGASPGMLATAMTITYEYVGDQDLDTFFHGVLATLKYQEASRG